MVQIVSNSLRSQRLNCQLACKFQWPPREPYTKFKIKTLLPEQKTIDIKKNGQVIRTVTVRRKTKKFTDRWARTFKKKMLAPNWSGHDIETNPIVNYFADRQHTELILRKIEKKIETRCFYCKKCENCNRIFQYKEVFKQQVFWTFNSEIKYWNVYGPDWYKGNKFLKLVPIRNIKFKV